MKRREAIFAGIMAVVALLLCELGLQVASRVFPGGAAVLSRNGTYPAIEDASLGWRPSPNFPGHDRNGFRNPSVPQQAVVVALGDSQTYGANVAREDAWPQQLEKLGEIKTYNMAFGGYGPTHSLVLLHEALQLRPRVIIEAFYSGNDLFDSYNHVYRFKQLPYLWTSDETVLKAIAEHETSKPLFPQRYSALYPKSDVQRRPTSPREFLAEYSKTYAMVRTLKDLFARDPVPPPRKDEFVFVYGTLKTILTPQYRITALDLSDPRIAEGHRVSLEAIRLMRDRTRDHDAGFKVLLLPTKELVFRELVEKTMKDVPIEYKSLVEDEEEMWQRSKRFFQEMGIQVIDALPVFRKHLEQGTQPYDESEDGHPNPLGHRIIAELVRSQIEDKQAATPQAVLSER